MGTVTQWNVNQSEDTLQLDNKISDINMLSQTRL